MCVCEAARPLTSANHVYDVYGRQCKQNNIPGQKPPLPMMKKTVEKDSARLSYLVVGLQTWLKAATGSAVYSRLRRARIEGLALRLLPDHYQVKHASNCLLLRF